MTNLSVNLNKIALLRNSRGNDFPNLIEFAKKFISLGVKGITVHPRQDERHIKRQDARDLAELLKDYPDVELNMEGYPSKDYLKLIKELKPALTGLNYTQNHMRHHSVLRHRNMYSDSLKLPWKKPEKSVSELMRDII